MARIDLEKSGAPRWTQTAHAKPRSRGYSSGFFDGAAFFAIFEGLGDLIGAIFEGLGSN